MKTFRNLFSKLHIILTQQNSSQKLAYLRQTGFCGTRIFSLTASFRSKVKVIIILRKVSKSRKNSRIVVNSCQAGKSLQLDKILSIHAIYGEKTGAAFSVDIISLTYYSPVKTESFCLILASNLLWYKMASNLTRTTARAASRSFSIADEICRL